MGNSSALRGPRTGHQQRLVSRRRLSSWQKLPSVFSTEALFASGLDGVCLDMANGCFSIETIAVLLSYQAGVDRATFVRTPEEPPASLIGRLLDEGADGIIIPHLHDPELASQYVHAAKFSPAGTRGMGSTGRAGQWGLGSRSDYVEGVRRVGWAPRVTGMIESKAALDDLERLLEVAQLDAVMVGSADLMLSTGLAFDELVEMLAGAVEVLRRASVMPAIAVGNSAQARACFDLGFQWCVVSNDLTMLARASARNVDAVGSWPDTESESASTVEKQQR